VSRFFWYTAEKSERRRGMRAGSERRAGGTSGISEGRGKNLQDNKNLPVN
jgi:hypothetical protein